MSDLRDKLAEMVPPGTKPRYLNAADRSRDPRGGGAAEKKPNG
jgi:hypothetical protein